MPQIRVLLGYQQGHVFSLDGRTMVIGRDPKSDIVLHPDSAASRRHAEVFFRDGHWRVRDMGSVNGTILNGRPIKDEILRDKDEVVIGDNVFVYEDKTTDAARIAEAASRTIPVDPKGFQNRPEIQALVRGMRERLKAMETEIGKVVVGQTEIIRDALTAILCQGHMLLVGMPGLAKSALARAFAEVLELKFKRIALTPDLVPTDVTGMDIVEVDEATGKKEFRFVQGPIFTQMLLADDINRTPPKTQAALLEAMQEYRVTVAGQTMSIEPPFFVLATQSALEHEGSHPLDEAQLDHFMFSVQTDYPAEAEEERIARAAASGPRREPLTKVMTAKEILGLQRAVRELPISDLVVKYAVRLVRASRPTDKRAPEFIKKYVHCGAGPRAAQYLILGAKAHALMSGRLLVTLEDIRSIARPTLRHRISTNFTADSEGMSADKIVQRLLKEVGEPGEKDA